MNTRPIVAGRIVLLFVGCCLSQSSAFAQAWPAKPLRFIANAAPAGPTDIVARVVGRKLTELMGQPVIVENRTGAGGNIGAVAVSKSAPDGYTALVTSTAFVANMALYPSPGYDAERDFVPVAILGRQPTLIVVNAANPARSLAELLTLSKTEGRLAFATPGTGTPAALTGEYLFKVLSKLDTTPIHYSGAGPAITAILGGEPAVGSLAAAAPMPHVKSGKLRALAISSATRIAALPNVPTLVELGFSSLRDYVWIGLFLPAGTPSVIAHQLNDSVNRALQSSDVRDRLNASVFEPVGGSLPETAQYVAGEVMKWRKVVLDTGAKP
jgi:tripartite-type tricarboxylate transporter receptor subunit TctC